MFEKESIKSSGSKPLASNQNQTAILLVCMGIAVLLWIANKLSHEYNGELVARVNYINVPEDNILSGKATETLTLHIKTKGSNLLWQKLTRHKISIDINVAKLPSNRNYVITGRLKPEISSRLPKGYELIAVLPDTLFYQMDKKFSKRVPVVLVSDISYEEQYGLAGKIILNPSEVVLSGPKQDIISVEKWETQKLVLKKLKSTQQGEITLQIPSFANATLEPAKIQYTIPVDEFTGHEVEVELKAVNVPPKTNLTLYPKKVKVSFQVSLKNFDKVKPSMFKVVADFSSHHLEKDKYAEIKVVQSPDFVKHVHVSPAKAEYIIHK